MHRVGGPPVSLVLVEATGDRHLEVPLSAIGGQGVFVKEVQAAVLTGRADLAVHSAKDLPARTPDGLTLGAVPERADQRDAMVGCSLAELPTGAIVATGSARRRAQLAWLRPDVGFVDLRGNMGTRLGRAEAVGAGVVAACALDRLGLADRIAERLDVAIVLPQVGQGAIAVECRHDDATALALLQMIDDPLANQCVTAERAFLAELGGGCTLPVGALAISLPAGAVAGPPLVHVEGMLASRSGQVLVRATLAGDDPVRVGQDLALHLLARCGGRSLGDWADPGDQ